MEKIVEFAEAEKKARLRDIENGKVLTEEELRLANELQQKAQSRGMKLVPDRKVKSRVKFAQMIQENWKHLNVIQYFTSEEIVFLIKIMPYIGFSSNCIVVDIARKEQVPMNQTEIAKVIGSDKTRVSKTIKKLMDKGVLIKAVGMKKSERGRAHAIFVNPNIIYSGDRDRVEESLKLMFSDVPEEIKKLPVKLF